MGIDLLVVTLPCVLVYTAVMLDEVPPNQLYAFIRETGPCLTYGLYHTKWLREGVCLSRISWYAICNGGPRKGYRIDNYFISIVVKVRR